MVGRKYRSELEIRRDILDALSKTEDGMNMHALLKQTHMPHN